jgi:hypothetical protein
LVDHGQAELAAAVENHPVGRLTEPAFESWIARATPEERIVAYADKRAIQRLGSIDRRFERWFREHPDLEPTLRLARTRALLLEREVCGMAGIAPDDVDRLRWTADALDRTGRRAAA